MSLFYLISRFQRAAEANTHLRDHMPSKMLISRVQGLDYLRPSCYVSSLGTLAKSHSPALNKQQPPDHLYLTYFFCTPNLSVHSCRALLYAALHNRPEYALVLVY